MKYFKKITLIMIILISINGCLQVDDVGSSKSENIAAPAAGSKYLYIAAGNTPMFCYVSLVDGSLSNCQNTGNGIPYAIGITVYKNNAYILNRNSNQIYKCNVTSNGSLVNCNVNYTDSTYNFINDAKSLTVYNGYLYIGNYGTSNVGICSFNSTGDLTNCSQTASSNVNTHTYVLRGNNSFMYFGFQTNSNIGVCTISATDGTLSSCNNGVNGSTNSPYGIAFSGSYFYDSDYFNSKIYACTITAVTGTIPSGNCTQLSDPTIVNPVDIAADSGKLYIINSLSNNLASLVKCNVSAATLSSCTTNVTNLFGNANTNQEVEMYLATF